MKKYSLEDFKEKSEYAFSHLQEFALDYEKQDHIQFVFEFIFEELPTYEEIESHTPKMYPFFSISSQQKNPQRDHFAKNSCWWGNKVVSHTS